MRRLKIVGVLLFFCIAPLTSFAQVQFQSFDRLEEIYPGVKFHENNGAVSMIYGTTLSTGTTPMESAVKHLNDWQGIYGGEVGNFVPQENPAGESLIGVMPNPATGEYKFYTVRLNQTFGGLPVFRSGVGFLIRNTENNPVVMTGFDVKQMNGFDVVAGGIGQVQVTRAMLKNVRETMNSAPDHSHGNFSSVLEESEEGESRSIAGLVKGEIGGDAVRIIAQRAEIEVSEEELVIWAGVNNVPEEPRLAISFLAQRGSIRTYPHYDKYLIVAAADTGEILLAESQITCLTDVQGEVTGRATDGVGSLECDPEVEFPLPYAEVSIQGGNSVFADANGNYQIPNGGTSAVDVTSPLRGRWFEVFDQSAGGSTPTLNQQVSPSSPANFLHNPNNNQDTTTANVNAYLEANRCRDFVLSYEPNFPTISTQQSFNINTNINDTCNATYDGSAINFFRAGGGCNNTSASDIVYHEYGHHLVAVTNNGQGQFGEGSGDCVGVIMQDEPILANGFYGNCGSGLRNADNDTQYPCFGGSHECGNLLSSAVWDTRNQLAVTEPNNYRDISASLFFGMLIVRGQTQPFSSTIDPAITIIYLELDDDDNDIGNGTPHYQEIAAGFGAHNLDAPELDDLEFRYPSGRPEMVSPGGGVAFIVEINDLEFDHESGSGMLHVDRGNGFESFPMEEISAGRYEANFPPSDCATILKYYFSAETTNNSTQSNPEGAPSEFFTALSADSVTTMFADDFNTNRGWSNSGNASDGQWGRGVPVGGGDRGDPAADIDGSGSCYLTDNEDGNSDVDGGTTILTSPILDATTGPGSVAVLSYSRWYSNHTGDSPEADTFVVEISNDGGGSWTNLETVGPSGVEVRGGWNQKTFRISDVITPTNQMRVRFSASDLGSGSVVEAGVDAFEIFSASCAQVVTADSINVIGGVVSAGDLDDLDASDDQRLSLRLGPLTVRRPVINADFKGVSPTANPGEIEFTFESVSAAVAGTIDQTIQMFDYDEDEYVVVDFAEVGADESTVVIQLTGELSRFIEPGTNCIKARVSFMKTPSPLSLRGDSVAIDIDELSWFIGN